jgi:hypothetical protein
MVMAWPEMAIDTLKSLMLPGMWCRAASSRPAT